MKHFAMATIRKRALVTGGSRGIGRAVCLALAQGGCDVIVNYLTNKSAAEETCQAISEMGVRCTAIQADCSNPVQVSQLFKGAIEQFGTIDILVNNAGASKDKLAIRTSPEEFVQTVNVNLNSAFFCSREALLTSMVPRKFGRIVNMSSVVGLRGNAGQSSYSAAKAGLVGLTKSLAREYGRRGICINAVCPGYIETDMTNHLDTTQLCSEIPLGRVGTTAEVAGLVRYLSLDESAAYITGHCFVIDGGLGIGCT